MNNDKRYCGILLHPTSLPGPFGIGDLGEEAKNLLKRFSSVGINLWQVLPLGPIGYGDSPYAARSTFAGNELLIDLRQLETTGEIYPSTSNDPSRINYTEVKKQKMNFLMKAAEHFLWYHEKDAKFIDFVEKNDWWLEDYALYQCLVHHFNDSRWFNWPTELKLRKPEAIKEWSEKLKVEKNKWKVLQFFFYSQWNSLHAFANSLGIEIIGDIPIFVAGDSVDAWTNRHLLKIDEQGNQTCSSGVPPDSFSAEGQLWGNPVYDWDKNEAENFDWWVKRVAHTSSMVDIVRIDHFRGLESYWEVPAGETSAVNGKWVKGPGDKLLKKLSNFKLIAEDLGVITKEVDDLRQSNNLPGMEILQFAFSLNNGCLDGENRYLPHNWEKNCIAYTGTHDNDTTRGWYNNLSDDYKDIVRRYFQSPDDDIVWQMIRSLLAGSEQYAVIPMQDLMGLGSEARMNIPSTVGNSNWSWRFSDYQLQDWMLNRLGEYIYIYGRK